MEVFLLKDGEPMLEMLVFIIGIYAFIFGRVGLPWKLSLSGWRARVAGIFLMAPLPILILLGRVVGRGVEDQAVLSFFGIMELVIVIIGILCAALFSYLTRPKYESAEQEERIIQ